MIVWISDKNKCQEFDGSFIAEDGSTVCTDTDHIAGMLHEMGAFCEDSETALVLNKKIGMYMTSSAGFDAWQEELTLRLKAVDHVEQLIDKHHLDKDDVWYWHLQGIWQEDPKNYIAFIDRELDEWIRRQGFTDDDVSYC